MTDLRALVRELLTEELTAMKRNVPGAPELAQVSIHNNAELNSFALHVLKVAKDRNLELEIKTGKFQFQLQGNHNQQNLVEPRPQSSSGKYQISGQKLITEKDLINLTGDVLRIDDGVCLTPLARDELRRKGIKLERNRK